MGGHCIMTSCLKWSFLTHSPCHAWSRFLRYHRDQWCSGGGRRGNAVPPLFSEGKRDPSLFCSISGIFSAEINEQRRLQDSQFLQNLLTELLTYWSLSQFRRYIYICYK